MCVCVCVCGFLPHAFSVDPPFSPHSFLSLRGRERVAPCKGGALFLLATINRVEDSFSAPLVVPSSSSVRAQSGGSPSFILHFQSDHFQLVWSFPRRRFPLPKSSLYRTARGPYLPVRTVLNLAPTQFSFFRRPTTTTNNTFRCCLPKKFRDKFAIRHF